MSGRGIYRRTQHCHQLDRLRRAPHVVTLAPGNWGLLGDSIRATLPPILEGHGFEVKTAARVPEASQNIGSHNCDGVLSAVNIRELHDGYTIVGAVREANPRCVAIIWTAYVDFCRAVESIHYDIDDYFVEPVDVDALVTTVRRRLAARLSQ